MDYEHNDILLQFRSDLCLDIRITFSPWATNIPSLVTINREVMTSRYLKEKHFVNIKISSLALTFEITILIYFLGPAIAFLANVTAQSVSWGNHGEIIFKVI